MTKIYVLPIHNPVHKSCTKERQCRNSQESKSSKRCLKSSSFDQERSQVNHKMEDSWNEIEFSLLKKTVDINTSGPLQFVECRVRFTKEPC